MRLTHSLLVMGLALAQAAVASDRIVGGTAAAAGEFPFIVSLQKGSSHFCGGSLIAKGWVLTAAHCVRSGTSSIKVKIGLQNLSDTRSVETFSPLKVIVHPENNSSTNDYDFALIHLKGESKFTPVQLNGAALTIPEEEANSPIATTAGWGTTSAGGSLSKKLLKVDVPLVSTKRCEEAYPDEITKTMVCAGLEEGGKDSCQGDSGGPLLVKNLSGEKVLAGVVSWGEGCASPKKYGVYGDVSSAVSWIEDQISAAN